MPRDPKFLPIVLIALAVQILAPIAGSWAAAIAASNPLQSAEICHTASGATSGQSDQSGGEPVQDGACVTCCVLQATASMDAPQHTAFTVLCPHTSRAVWTTAALDLSPPRAGSNTQARAPPLSM